MVRPAVGPGRAGLRAEGSVRSGAGAVPRAGALRAPSRADPALPGVGVAMAPPRKGDLSAEEKDLLAVIATGEPSRPTPLAAPGRSSHGPRWPCPGRGFVSPHVGAAGEAPLAAARRGLPSPPAALLGSRRWGPLPSRPAFRPSPFSRARESGYSRVERRSPLGRPATPGQCAGGRAAVLGKLRWAGLILPRTPCILPAMSVDICLIIGVNVHCQKKKVFLGLIQASNVL